MESEELEELTVEERLGQLEEKVNFLEKFAVEVFEAVKGQHRAERGEEELGDEDFVEFLSDHPELRGEG
jgi:hypothetical protein